MALLAYALLVGASQMLWHNLVPLWSLGAESVFDSVPGLFPRWVPVLVFLLLSIPAGALIDRWGYYRCVGAATAMLLASAFLRVGASPWTLLVGQVGICLAHPLVITAVNKVTTNWMTPRRQGLAVGLVLMAASTGTAAEQVAGMMLVEDLGVRWATLAYALATLVPGAAFMALARKNPNPAAPTTARLFALMGRRDLWMVCGVALCGTFAFFGVAGWLVSLLSFNGIETGEAMVAVGALLAGSVVGAVVIPALSDRLGRRRPLMILCAAASLVVVFPLCASESLLPAVVLGGLFGIFCLPLWPLALVLSSHMAGPRRAGLSAGVLMLWAQAGMATMSLAIELAEGSVAAWEVPPWAAIVSLTLALALALLVREAGAETI